MGPIAVIGGSGRHGSGLAARWARAGARVIIGSRQAAKGTEAAERIRRLIGKGDITAASNRAAAESAEVIVLAIPYAAQADILGDIGEAARGKVVVDTSVPLRRGAPPELEVVSAGSAAAQAQVSLPGARVVAAFHTVSDHLLRRLDEPVEADVLICGDDPEAKRVVIGLVEALGARPLDVGTLAQAATLERLAALIIGLNTRYGRKAIGVRFTGV